jgi:hypothetical protein
VIAGVYLCRIEVAIVQADRHVDVVDGVIVLSQALLLLCANALSLALRRKLQD